MCTVHEQKTGLKTDVAVSGQRARLPDLSVQRFIITGRRATNVIHINEKPSRIAEAHGYLKAIMQTARLQGACTEHFGLSRMTMLLTIYAYTCDTCLQLSSLHVHHETSAKLNMAHAPFACMHFHVYCKCLQVRRISCPPSITVAVQQPPSGHCSDAASSSRHGAACCMPAA